MANRRTKDDAVAPIRAAHKAGDFRAARALARNLADNSAADEADRAIARDVLSRTAPDPRALAVAIAALALAALVIVVFLVA